MPKKPFVNIDWEQVADLCRLHCTEDEVAHILRVSVNSLKRRCKREKKKTFELFYWEHAAHAQASLRRQQWAEGMGYKGKKTILDRKVIKSSGTDGKETTETIYTPKVVEFIKPPNPKILERLCEVVLGQGREIGTKGCSPVGAHPELPQLSGPKAGGVGKIEIIVKHVGAEPGPDYDKETASAVEPDPVPGEGTQ